jgi:thiol-disulfide isomerase/thioredoxin
MRLLLIPCAMLALAACQKPAQQPANEVANAAQAGPIKGVDRSHEGQTAPDATFQNLDGAEVEMSQFSGTPVLLNLWATWCAPCVKELPTLDRLAKAHRKTGDLQVVAVSQDSGPSASVAAFLDSHRITDLEPYQDSDMRLSGALGPDAVLPTSILFDAQGREVWRYVGDLDWTGPQAAKLLAEAQHHPGLSRAAIR